LPPLIASVIFSIGIAGLFYLDRDRTRRFSIALWVPMAWLFICLSRPLSAWLGLDTGMDQAASYVEGSPVDAAFFEILEFLALIVVFTRRGKVVPLLRKNWPICLFFIYAAMSISWSDFPFVTLKHWIKGIGDVLMVLIVLTEADVPEAIRSMFSRLAFLLLPISVLWIKYYPQLGRQLTLSWTESAVGVAEQKNSLGELCDILGIVLLWRLRSVYLDREDPARKRRLVVLGTVLGMIVWLLWMCDSLTSICTLSMAITVILLSTRPAFRRKPALVHILMSGLVFLAMYALFFQSSGSLVEGLGRNSTLTGRTEIWQTVTSVPNHRLIGTGYESFWLGQRLERMWQAFPGLHLNEAHNGYIEILISLGWIGEILLAIVIITGYRNVIRSWRTSVEMGSLKLALVLPAIVTGFTEASFRMMGPPWIVFVLAVFAVNGKTAASGGTRVPKRTSVGTFHNADVIQNEDIEIGSVLCANARS